MFNSDQREKLQHACAAEVQFDVLLKSYTTFGIGGKAAALIKLLDCEEIFFIASFCRKEKVPWLCIGKGSNLLVVDDGFDGVAFSLGGAFSSVESIKKDTEGSLKIIVGAGVSLARLVSYCEEHCLAGLEFATGIPGTVGGATVMNAGAWGGEMAQVIRRVKMAGENGVQWLEGPELDFSYRNWSSFQQQQKEKLIAIVAVEFELRKDESCAIHRRRLVFIEKRKKVQKVHKPNAGSFFKNPSNGDSAGRLIEAAGCKGMRVGGAMVAQEHANFFVNMGGATAADILELEKKVKNRVEKQFAVRLQREVRFVDSNGDML